VRRTLELFFIGSPLFTSGFPGADESNHVAALGVGDDQEPTARREAEKNQALLGCRVIRVRDGRRFRVSKAVVASGNETPCLRRLAAAFAGSQTNSKAIS